MPYLDMTEMLEWIDGGLRSEGTIVDEHVLDRIFDLELMFMRLKGIAK